VTAHTIVVLADTIVGVTSADGLGGSDTETVGIRLPVPHAVGDGDTLTVAHGDGDTLTVAHVLGDADATALIVATTDFDAEIDADAADVRVASNVLDGVSDGVVESETDAVGDVEVVAAPDAVERSGIGGVMTRTLLPVCSAT